MKDSNREFVKVKYREREAYIDNTNRKWRWMLFYTNVIFATIILATEIAMYFVFKSQNLFLQPVPVYLFRFLILPTLLDAANLGIGLWMMRTMKNQKLLNYIPVIQLTLICFMVSTVHNIFAVTFGTFCFPIFLTTMFNDRGMTRLTTILSLISLTVAQLLGPAFNDMTTTYLLPEYIVSLVALTGAGIVSYLFAKFQDEKNQMIQSIHKRQLNTLKQLNLDQKTGLYGSTAFHNHLSQVIEHGKGRKKPALLILDIDDFKHINDTYGHARGDEVILRLAGLMQDMCGDRQFPARFGGEEFAVVFDGVNRSDCLVFADTLRNSFAKMKYEFTDTSITLSAGLAWWHTGWSEMELFDAADAAMYRSKQQGKNRTSVYYE